MPIYKTRKEFPDDPSLSQLYMPEEAAEKIRMTTRNENCTIQYVGQLARGTKYYIRGYRFGNTTLYSKEDVKNYCRTKSAKVGEGPPSPSP